MATRTKAKLTGERPQQGVTPDSLLALHAAGYRAVIERLGPGRLLDVGCGQGFESVGFVADDRPCRGRGLQRGGHASAGHGSAPGACGWAAWTPWPSVWPAGAFDWVCSSHLIEHFVDPAAHVAEIARVLADDGAAFFLTPNEPADFENPFHLHLFGHRGAGRAPGPALRRGVGRGGRRRSDRVKADFAARRAKAERLLRLDVFDLRHRMPRSWYVAAYTRLLPLAYRLMARGDTGGATGITADDWFVTDEVDDTTLVLFAVGRRPRRSPAGRLACWPSA